MKIKVKRLTPNAILPKKAHNSDAAFDLFCKKDIVIRPNQTVLVDLGIACEPPEGYFLLILPRSSMANTPLRIPNSAGVIDPGYRGSIKVPLYNCDASFNGTKIISAGERIAQMLVLPLIQAEIEEAEELSPSERGQNGFGSTGK